MRTTRHYYKSWHFCKNFKRKEKFDQNHSFRELKMKIILLITCFVHFVMSKAFFRNKHSRFLYNKYLQLYKVRKWVKRFHPWYNICVKNACIISLYHLLINLIDVGWKEEKAASWVARRGLRCVRIGSLNPHLAD